MSNDIQMKTCPFCGQFAMLAPDIDPRDACTCDGAQRWRARCRVYEARVSAMEKLCGKECEKISAHYHPVGEETFVLLKDVLHGGLLRSDREDSHCADGRNCADTQQEGC